MKLNRQALLQCLEAVAPGLASETVVEQADCFVFHDGLIRTFNDEVSCSIPQPNGCKITGAIKAKTFLTLLQKLEEEELDVEVEKHQLRFTGKGGRTFGFPREAEIALPFDYVTDPTEWHPLPKDFCEAVGIVAECANKKDESFKIGCIHLAPDIIEACDNYQVGRYWIETGLSRTMLVKVESISTIADLGMNEFAQSKGWLHFRNEQLQLSCKRHLDEYLDTDPLFEIDDAHEVVLPTGLADEIDKAVIIANDMRDPQVRVDLRPGGMRISVQNDAGVWYKKPRKADYEGPAFSFSIAPKLLAKISARHTKCQIGSNNRLLIDSDKFQYVACLNLVDDEEPAPKKRTATSTK